MNLGGNDDEIKQAFQSVDADYSGLIEWSEFSKSIKESVTYLVVCLLTEIYLILKNKSVIWILGPMCLLGMDVSISRF